MLLVIQTSDLQHYPF